MCHGTARRGDDRARSCARIAECGSPHPRGAASAQARRGRSDFREALGSFRAEEFPPAEARDAWSSARAKGLAVALRSRDCARPEQPHCRGTRLQHESMSAVRSERRSREGVWRVRKSVTRRIDSVRCVGPRQSFCTSRLGARGAISALVSAGCGVSLPGWSRSAVRQRLTSARLPGGGRRAGHRQSNDSPLDGRL
jgi:hypothetical protein